ncbi:MAG TPA: hybrid sensor histidine kinase/response regulator, partial [Ktedonobacterales bacterium]|nr:hybrid sensor histidine kinase/response regulator [Ktedonobacterales bacterium]
IVLDVGLPDTDGLTVCRQLKNDARTADIPVLFLTGKDDINDRVAGLDAGAQDYLVKPFAMPEFQARLRAILRTQQETEEARAQVSQRQDEFLSILNHELRAPLTVINMASQILSGNQQISDQRRNQLVQSIHNSADALTHIIDDLLYLANPVRHLKLCQIRPIITSVVEESRPRIQEHGLHLIPRIPPDLPAFIVDEAQLRRSLLHLIDNAIKFTPRSGVITLTVVVAQQGNIVISEPDVEQEIVSATPQGLLSANNDDPWVIIAVRDTGIGIAQEHHRHVFEPFYQVDSSPSRTTQGLGLGLAVVAAFVRAHQGQLAVRSGDGMGTAVSIALPARTSIDENAAPDSDGPESA